MVDFKAHGITFNCAEQFMMYMKAIHFKDWDSEERILKATHPYQQKKLGRKVKNFNTEEWNKYAKIYVSNGNHEKFTQNPKHLEYLLSTKGTTLVEASLYDKVWGIGLGIDDPSKSDPKNWKGTNWLGEVLTELRDDLIKEGDNI